MSRLRFFYNASLLYLATAYSSEIPVADLMSHLNFLTLQHTPLNTTNFELGLTYQLLADAAAGADSIVPLGEWDLRRKAEESYRLCILEDPNNTDALSNLAKLLTPTSLHSDSDQNLITSILSLYELVLTIDPLHFQSYINSGLFLRQLGRHQDAAIIFNRGQIHHPNSTILR
mmetsp:Transcript_28671/g.61155  ORF Transcript_28671/g.61155 Transcript_28671/m.61155 type:complete len:173 (-) Transcript_28671:528-1046(-)|eukprot:CAMPEP_0172322964 /NCGR_PEP_ID=MMETSP1058-20130122/47448_1 /TAXON_ID=83371 /ORGANISM="Detonula confervacea, Strain CCMP 353" /LENGTH=172 /DNA_ID=CAMNT_0013038843 /DNA_START=30 /DNA_END=548 /DNA_ORIENTATION=+